MSALLSVQQIERLRRKTWQSASELAEEIYAMLTSDDPYRGPTINIEQQGDGPVINIIPSDSGGDPITSGPPINPGDPTNPDTTPVTGGGGLPGEPGDTTIIENPALPANFPLCGWGIVQSKVSGNVYLVDIYLGNPTSAPLIGSLNVVQRQIDTTDEIPAGTETMVMLTTSIVNNQIVITAGTMQVPVFLEP